MLKQGGVTSKTVHFIIKGFVHDLYLQDHVKIGGIGIEAYKIQTADDLPVLDPNKIPKPDSDVPKKTANVSKDTGYYEIFFDSVPSGVYCVKVPLNLLTPKYDSKSYYINIAVSDTYNQDIILVDTKKRQKIEDDPKKVNIHEIFMVE